MKCYLLVCIIMLASLINVKAQTIQFCNSYTPEGKALDHSNKWSIKLSGGYVTVLFNNAGKNIPTPTLLFEIERQNPSGSILKLESKTVKVDKSKKFALLEYKFITPGEYNFKVLDKNKLLASGKVNIRLSSSSITGTGPIDTYYYSSSKLSSGVNFIDSTGHFQKKTSSFAVDKNAGGYVTFKLNGNKALNTDKIVVEIYKLQEVGSDHYETKAFNISNINWHWTSFNLTFYEAGSYQIKAYNGAGVWISECFITVTNK